MLFRRRSRVEFAKRLDSAADLREAWEGSMLGPSQLLYTWSGNDEHNAVSAGPACSCVQHATFECSYCRVVPYLVELVVRGVGM